MEDKKYKNLKELREDYFILEDLQNFLNEEGYSGIKYNIRRWEKLGIIPEPARIRFLNSDYRVYNKDGSDFKLILESLKKGVKKRVRSKA